MEYPCLASFGGCILADLSLNYYSLLYTCSIDDIGKTAKATHLGLIQVKKALKSLIYKGLSAFSADVIKML